MNIHRINQKKQKLKGDHNHVCLEFVFSMAVQVRSTLNATYLLAVEFDYVKQKSVNLGLESMDF